MIGVSMPLKQHDESRLGEMIVQTDYLSAGNVIGEMGSLVGSPRSASIICETNVKVCFDNLRDKMCRRNETDSKIYIPNRMRVSVVLFILL